MPRRAPSSSGETRLAQPVGENVRMPLEDEATRAAARYESAEREYLLAVRAGVEPEVLAAAVKRVASAAELWNRAAYASYFALREMDADAMQERNADIQTEISEVLSELWRDISDAHAGAVRPVI